MEGERELARATWGVRMCLGRTGFGVPYLRFTNCRRRLFYVKRRRRRRFKPCVSRVDKEKTTELFLNAALKGNTRRRRCHSFVTLRNELAFAEIRTAAEL